MSVHKNRTNSVGSVEKGSALVTTMIAVFVISGLIASLFSVVLSASRESTVRVEAATALEMADSGVERVLADLYECRIADHEGKILAGFSPGLQYGDDGAYTVQVSSYREDGRAVPDSLFDIYEVTSYSLVVPPGQTEETGFFRGVQVVVELPYTDDLSTLKPIPGGVVAQGGADMGGNSVINGSDHTRSTMDSEGVHLKTDAQLDMTYQSSSAGYVSEFWVKHGDEEYKIFDDSKSGEDIGAMSQQVFPKDSTLNFYIRTFAPDDTYNHYAFGDDPSAVYYPPDGGDPIPYCRIEQLDDITYRLFFEDLEGSIADWDYGDPGDLESDTADQVIDVVIVPSGESTVPGQSTTGFVPGPGIPAIAYPGDYADFGLSDTSSHLVYTDENGTVHTGVDAYTQASVPLDNYAQLFMGSVEESYTTSNLNNDDLGGSGDYQVTHVTAGSSGKVQISGQKDGSGILVVDGDLHVSGQFHYDGLVIVKGDVRITGSDNTTRLVGALMATGEVEMKGNGKLYYSSDAVNKALEDAGLTLDDLKALLLPPNIGAPVRRLWRELDDAEVRLFQGDVGN
jgi:hypothetical protein